MGLREEPLGPSVWSFSYLAIVGDSFFVFLNDILWTKAVLGPPDLCAGVCVDAIGGERTWLREEREGRD